MPQSLMRPAPRSNSWSCFVGSDAHESLRTEWPHVLAVWHHEVFAWALQLAMWPIHANVRGRQVCRVLGAGVCHAASLLCTDRCAPMCCLDSCPWWSSTRPAHVAASWPVLRPPSSLASLLAWVLWGRVLQWCWTLLNFLNFVRAAAYRVRQALPPLKLLARAVAQLLLALQHCLAIVWLWVLKHGVPQKPNLHR